MCVSQISVGEMFFGEMLFGEMTCDRREHLLVVGSGGVVAVVSFFALVDDFAGHQGTPAYQVRRVRS
jgi:hypothetical protein